MQPCVIRLTSEGASVWVPVEPVPASRPRVTRWGVYYGKRYTKFRRDVKEILGQMRLPKGLPLSGPMLVVARFMVTKPKTSVRRWPNGDLDNYLKTLDSFNEVLWDDDDQIIEFEASKHFAGKPVDGFSGAGIRLILRKK